MTKFLVATVSTLAFASASFAADMPNSPTAAPGTRGRQGTNSDHRQVAGCRQGPVWEEPAAAGGRQGLIGQLALYY